MTLEREAKCVGGPLHGMTLTARGRRMVVRTVCRDLGVVAHVYELRLVFPGSGAWVWRMCPRWTVSGFVKPAK